MAEIELKLMVAEAVDEDKNKAIVRIDEEYLDRINVKIDELVELIGKKRAIAVAKKSYPGDIGLNFTRIGKHIRTNIDVDIGDIVYIKKANQLKL